MKNIINYYYNLNILDLYEIDDKYYFTINNNSYIFMPFNRLRDEVKSIYNLYIELISRKIFTNELINNKMNEIITQINNTPYVLLKDNTKHNNITINDILYIQNNTFNISNDKYLYRNSWVRLWSSKIDYYEEQLKDILKKYKVLSETLDYYIGLGENAISYLVYNNPNTNNLVLSHKRIGSKTTSFDFYNPINYIIDSRVRDFSEFIKSLFFQNELEFDTFKYYLEYLNFSKDEYILLIARLLFPTYYFDIYDNIINLNLNEDIIKNVINKNNDYIRFLKKTFYYIIYTKRINIPYIEWIIKSD